ncbi:hypothetical protein CONCODRAFT_3452 [Conidiobolus coronatus NRRL 28638]|uniref:Uncharacterized protein n=1 Tax=Conidiobolus coronatus (strain ATCC 28846 / CBS 209.66 / NRRL 28638) TaxID=796925 RepID=A0A137PFC6_CONC2|nr:hypothetical protein CONCODRAFT_3452 [Conidiobolus coronatus NRRL 28638]|eukprot:KXN73631.1 hypothetical protein CONCODRAFT_3452 [Conidiobolus coronatus NRRL 28638]
MDAFTQTNTALCEGLESVRKFQRMHFLFLALISYTRIVIHGCSREPEGKLSKRAKTTIMNNVIKHN